VSLGDPAGIGPEVIAKSWERRREENLPPFLAVGSVSAVRAVWDGPIALVDDPLTACDEFDEALPILRVKTDTEVVPGRPDFEGARNSLDALEFAVGLTRSGAAAGLVTGPVSKAQLYAIGFVHPGQTEFVAERCGVAVDLVAMMLAGPTLRVIPVTTHIPLREVPRQLSIERIVTKGRAAIRGLQRHERLRTVHRVERREALLQLRGQRFRGDAHQDPNWRNTAMRRRICPAASACMSR